LKGVFLFRISYDIDKQLLEAIGMPLEYYMQIMVMEIVVAIILILTGLACFALFYKSIGFFENI